MERVSHMERLFNERLVALVMRRRLFTGEGETVKGKNAKFTLCPSRREVAGLLKTLGELKGCLSSLEF